MLKRWSHSNRISLRLTFTSGEEVMSTPSIFTNGMRLNNAQCMFIMSQSALHLTDGQDNNEVLSTPFTKREEDAPDISSSTMKVCSKQVMFGEDELVGV